MYNISYFVKIVTKIQKNNNFTDQTKRITFSKPCLKPLEFEFDFRV